MSSAIALGVLAVGATAYSAHEAGQAADAQTAGANQANALSRDQTQQSRVDNRPVAVTGAGAINQLARTFGLPYETMGQAQAGQDVYIGDQYLPAGSVVKNYDGANGDVFIGDTMFGHLQRGGPHGLFIADQGVDINALRTKNQPSTPGATAGTPDMSGFFTSPGYQFRRQQGTQGVVNAFGSSGGAFSGNALKALADFNSGLASDEVGKYTGELNTLAGLGQNATAQNNVIGANAATTQGRNSLYAGDARASGIEDQANIINSGINQLGGIAGYYKKKPTTIPGPYGN